MRDIFTGIYNNNLWSGRQSRSGSGSDLEETVNIREKLPEVFKRYEIKSLLDIPCGDMNWMAKILVDENITYYGADIVPKLIDDNINREYRHDNIMFRLLDITRDELPKVDLILTRDCLGHLTNANVDKAVKNIKRAQPKYFIATHWPTAVHKDILDGGWRPINMEHYLDNSFKLIELIEEDIKDKYLGVYELSR